MKLYKDTDTNTMCIVKPAPMEATSVDTQLMQLLDDMGTDTCACHRLRTLRIMLSPCATHNAPLSVTGIQHVTRLTALTRLAIMDDQLYVPHAS